MEAREEKSAEQLQKELLNIIDRQLDVGNQLKQIIENYTKLNGIALSEEMVKARELFIESESLQAEGRAVYHSLFGPED